MKRSWRGEYENVAILIAIGVNKDGFREILGAAESMKEDKERWKSFLLWLKERGLSGVKSKRYLNMKHFDTLDQMDNESIVS